MKALISSGILFLVTCIAYGQAGRSVPMYGGHAVIIPGSSSYLLPVVYQLHDGTAMLSNGTRLRGRFLYNKGSAFIFYQDGHSPGKRIYFREFENLTLAGTDTSLLVHRDSTVFTKVGNHFFRQLTIGKVGLFDETYAVNENKSKLSDVLFTWGDDGSVKRLQTLEKANQWFYEICLQNHWPNSDVFLSKAEIIKRLAQLDPTP